MVDTDWDTLEPTEDELREVELLDDDDLVVLDDDVDYL